MQTSPRPAHDSLIDTPVSMVSDKHTFLMGTPNQKKHTVYDQ